MNKKVFFSLVACIMIVAGSFLVLRSRSATVSKIPSTTLPAVVSFYPLAYFTQQVGGSLVSVETLVSPGMEPHDFEPTPQQIVHIQNAKLFIYNGAGLETWAPRVIAELPKEKVINTTEHIEVLTSREEPDAPFTSDPHVWMNPHLAIQQVESIRDGLIKADSIHAQEYQQNADKLIAQLNELGSKFQHGLATCQLRTIVTSHSAFAYMAKQYNLQVLSIAGLSPEEEPTPQKLVEVAKFVKQNQVKYIFFETLVSPKLSQTIAQETGAQTTSFNPLEGLTPSEVARGKNYFTVQEENLQNLRQALTCN